jgi:hypothetical protein
MKARVTTLALTLLLIGLAAPHHLAPGPDSALATPGDVRVVPQQKSTEPPEKSTPEKRKKQSPAGPMEIFSDIEKGWSAETVELILKHFGDGRVTISIDGTGPSGGQFSKNQSYYLLTDMFKYTITKKFEIVQYHKPDDTSNTSFVVAERFYQRTNDGRLFKDKIYVSLHLEPAKNVPTGKRWVVDEIKSIR